MLGPLYQETCSQRFVLYSKTANLLPHGEIFKAKLLAMISSLRSFIQFLGPNKKNNHFSYAQTLYSLEELDYLLTLCVCRANAGAYVQSLASISQV